MPVGLLTPQFLARINPLRILEANFMKRMLVCLEEKENWEIEDLRKYLKKTNFPYIEGDIQHKEGDIQ